MMIEKSLVVSPWGLLLESEVRADGSLRRGAPPWMTPRQGEEQKIVKMCSIWLFFFFFLLLHAA